MQPNRVKRQMQAGKTAFGVSVHLDDPAVVELIGLGGLDAAFLDMEPSALELGAIQEMIRAAELVDITPIVRVPSFDPKLIGRLLDLGAQGIQVPHIQSREEAEKAVQAVRYHPLGERGASPVARATRYGAIEWDEHTTSSNHEIHLAVMVEDMRGLKNLDSIAEVKGVDLIAIGPSDLSESAGISQPNDPKLRSLVEDIATKLQQIGNAKMGFPHGHRMLTATVGDLQRWGVGYANVGPAIERVLLAHFREKVAQLLAEAEKADQDKE